MFQEVLINKSELKKFIEIADSTPEEVCGILTGQVFGSSPANVASFDELHMIDNITTEKTKWDFKMDPVQAYKVLMQTRYVNKKAKKEYTGIIHSHPSGKPDPSHIDLNNACDDIVWIIYSPLYKKTKAFTYDKQNNEFYNIEATYYKIGDKND